MKKLDADAGCGLLVVFGVLLVLCGGCATGALTGGIHFSDGHREGVVQKFSHKGWVWKTYEGELAMSGWRKVAVSETDSVSSNVFSFSVEDQEVARQIESLHADERVRLHYKQYGCSPPWRGSTGYFVWKVERLND